MVCLEGTARRLVVMGFDWLENFPQTWSEHGHADLTSKMWLCLAVPASKSKANTLCMRGACGKMTH